MHDSALILLLRLPIPSPPPLQDGWTRMGKSIDRPETQTSAVLLCRDGHTVRHLDRCRAQGPACVCRHVVDVYGRRSSVLISSA